jgi:hypothetical protein
VGWVRALTLRVEPGDLPRFAGVGHFASYGRWVGSEPVSDGKGPGHTQNGDQDLAWAFIEAATFALRPRSEAFL